jgi:ParB family transcriptional regulator, chromosome partitioning protein
MSEKSALFGDLQTAPVVAKLAVSAIEPDPNQPRKVFDKGALKELAQTIKQNGLVQPITVRSVEGGKYMIIAGERRWRAVQLNGDETIDAVVRDDLDHRACSLIENIQRENLKPLEEADAIAELIASNNISQGDVANMLGMGRASVNQLLKIRDLPDEVRLESLELNTPKSILVELASIKDTAAITKLWKKSKNEALSLAQIRAVRNAKKTKKDVGDGVELSRQEKAIRSAFDSLEALKDHPLSEAERARLSELHAKITALLEEGS